jgi:hypothetical protein
MEIKTKHEKYLLSRKEKKYAKTNSKTTTKNDKSLSPKSSPSNRIQTAR